MLKIYRSLKEMSQDNQNTSCFNCYIKDVNVRVQLFANCLYITDLTNAFKRGKECRKTVITYSERTSEKFLIELDTKYLYPNKKDLADLIEEVQNLHVSNLQDVGFDIELREEKSSTVFSPFADIKPIKLPKNGKWTKSHVVKAIITGQIYSGKVDSIYTDDYSYDASVNYHENEDLDLMEMAEKLTKSNSGWSVRVKEENKGNVLLDVDCCTFNYNTLYFNIDSRENNIEYVEVATEDIEREQDRATVVNTTTTITDLETKQDINTSSKVVNLFVYKNKNKINNKSYLISYYLAIV